MRLRYTSFRPLNRRLTEAIDTYYQQIRASNLDPLAQLLWVVLTAIPT
ncbi:MAG: hypothetical protein HC847_29995 [Hydrococcus sp. RU_2_2]|nr:hypothetical protein [Hydrococcus sp. RU_2_2]